MKKNPTLWSRNFTLLISASMLGCIGGIIGSYAMSFLVFDKTGSTLATGLLTTVQIIPYFLLPIFVAPIMDRFPRKPFLVGGDLVGGLLYGIAGLYLHYLPFSYGTYLVFSLIVNCVNAFDMLAFECIFPKIIPEGFQEKGYTVSAMLYPVMNVLMMPLAAVLMDTIGVANILLIQCGFSMLAALTESRIKLNEKRCVSNTNKGIKLWLDDLKDGICYLKQERGLLNIHIYSAITNGAATGYGPILVAFFRSTPGFSAGMYAFFSGAEFIGRSIGGAYRYKTELKKEKKQGFVYFVQQFYNIMDAILLWLPYPLMLVNRAVCGFLGINSGTVRQSCVQKYVPEEYRARVNSFSEALICAAGCVASVVMGLLGELMDYRIAMTAIALLRVVACVMTIWRRRKDISAIYEV